MKKLVLAWYFVHMKTRDAAIAFLYANEAKFANDAAKVFEANGWTWGNLGPSELACAERESACAAHEASGACSFSRVPRVQDIACTVGTLVWECIKNGGQNSASTGRIQVFLRQTDRGEWISGIELVPVAVHSY